MSCIFVVLRVFVSMLIFLLQVSWQLSSNTVISTSKQLYSINLIRNHYALFTFLKTSYKDSNMLLQSKYVKYHKSDYNCFSKKESHNIRIWQHRLKRRFAHSMQEV